MSEDRSRIAAERFFHRRRRSTHVCQAKPASDKDNNLHTAWSFTYQFGTPLVSAIRYTE